MKILSIAIICHELNRAYCQQIGDTSQVPWDEAPAWQQASALQGVRAIEEGDTLAASDRHKSWMKQKLNDGWVYGDIIDPVTMTHPCIIPFIDLPQEQQLKDHLFFNTASILLNKEDI